MQISEKYKKYLIALIVIILLGGFIFWYVKDSKLNEEKVENNEEISLIKTTTKAEAQNSFFVDIKGAVKNPGVYEFNDGDKIVDAIKKAGGLTSTAVTTNINLSQKLKSEMVVYIFTKTELKSTNSSTVASATTTACKCETIEINNCVTPKTTTATTSETSSASSEIDTTSTNSAASNNNLVNINTSSAEELTKLSGIGDAKAKAIVAYRDEHGNFEKIEDIMNVSGLGETIFGKIKDNITV